MKLWSLWWRYWLVFPGLRSYGQWLVPKHILVQAWGRNEYPDEFRVADMYARSGQQDATTLVALRRDQFSPGLPNIELARVLGWLLRQRTDLQAWVQWEVVAAMDSVEYAQSADRIVILWPPRSGYYDSAKVMNQAIERGFGHDQTSLMVLAHQRMIVRMLLMVQRRLGCDVVAAPSHVTGFDQHSVQAHTAHAWQWYPREAFGRWFIFPFRRLV